MENGGNYDLRYLLFNKINDGIRKPGNDGFSVNFFTYPIFRRCWCSSPTTLSQGISRRSPRVIPLSALFLRTHLFVPADASVFSVGLCGNLDISKFTHFYNVIHGIVVRRTTIVITLSAIIFSSFVLLIYCRYLCCNKSYI